MAHVQIQPSEIVRPWLTLIVSQTQQYTYLILPLLIIFIQPDLGGVISTLSILIPFVLYDSKLKKIAIIGTVLLLIFSPLVWHFGLHSYQKDRITFFLHPQKDPQGKGYNLIQSKIAIGSGGFFGKGYKKGSQGQLLFLPEKHTDFIFAAMSEELGLIAVLILFFAYYILLSSLIKKYYSKSISNQNVFSLSLAFQIWFQIFVNIGMNLGLLPVTGTPLPFMSVGGSSVMSLFFALGLVFST